jgi:hypothetical protein
MHMGLIDRKNTIQMTDEMVSYSPSINEILTKS